MFANGYVGTTQDSIRIRRQEKQREEQRKKYADLTKEKQSQVQSAGLREFGVSSAEAYEAAFKNETVGLVTREEFMRKQATIQERIEDEKLKQRQEAEAAAIAAKEKRKRDKHKAKPKLSFLADDDAEAQQAALPSNQEDNPSTSGAAATAAATTDDAPAAKKPKYSKLGKDPTVPTDFLPDKDRELQEEQMKAQLKKEWAANQARLRNEPLKVTYSYWDGQGHRKDITIRKGDSIGTFLKAVRDQIAPQFRELRAVSVDNLMYIKEDIILPHHYTFYELILSKARGKSGPLFDFGVHEDIRVTNDASVEKTDAHAGKVVERHWYERNKHIFPANRWEIYDPEKQYDKYSIRG
eukprot:jgi/Chrzof1/1826/Cz10g22180.t1